eukprot:scaffold289_cov147-Amphora_coffeaeformis.AAC.3
MTRPSDEYIHNKDSLQFLLTPYLFPMLLMFTWPLSLGYPLDLGLGKSTPHCSFPCHRPTCDDSLLSHPMSHTNFYPVP